MERDGRKIPLDGNGDRAGVTWTRAYMSFETAREAANRVDCDGLAFCFSADDPFCGIDLDDCLKWVRITEDGQIRVKVKAWAVPILERFGGTWIEISPGHQGVKIWCRAVKPPSRSQAIVTDSGGEILGAIECYDRGRSFAYTDLAYRPYCGDEIADRQDAVDWLCESYLGIEDPAAEGSFAIRPGIEADGMELLQLRAREYLAKIDPPAEGQRNNVLFRATGGVASLVTSDMVRLPDQEIIGLMLDWNGSLANPLPAKEVIATVRSNLASPNPRIAKPPGILGASPILDSWVSEIPRGRHLASSETRSEETDGSEAQTSSGGDLEASCADSRAIVVVPSVDDQAEAIGWIDEGSVEPLPCHLYDIEGFIGDFVRLHAQTCFWHQPDLAFACALTLQAALCGRKLKDAQGSRSNLYCLGVAPSATGKEHARMIATKILDSVGLWSKVGGLTKPKSAGGIGAALRDWPVRLALVDEFGMFLERHTRKGGGWKSDVDEALLELFTSANGKWSQGQYRDGSNLEIDRPHLSVYGTTTPKTVWPSITLETIGNGLLGRILVFFGRSKPKSNGMAGTTEIEFPREMLDHARGWAEHGGELAGTTMASEAIVRYSPEARERLHGIKADLTAQIEETDNDLMRPALSRAIQMVPKLALIFAASRSFADPQVTVEALDWAKQILDRVVLGLYGLVEGRVQTSQYQSDQDRIVEWILRNGNDVSKSDILRHFRCFRAKELNELMGSLIAARIIETHEIPGKKTSTRFRVIVKHRIP